MAWTPLRDTALMPAPANNIDTLNVRVSDGPAGTIVYGPFYNAKAALRLAVNITAIAAGSLTVTILGYDQTSGATWTMLASAALGSTGLTLLSIGPQIAASANVKAQEYAPVFYKLSCVIATGPVSYTIGAHDIG